jgi:pimeloyl-ACP methyl ester carboxylesterase
VSPPRVHYARSGGVHVAYQVFGEGPIDLVMVPGFVSNVEVSWENPPYARLLERLATRFRVILFDKRGTGLSDRGVGIPDLETRMDDVRAVMDAAGSQKAALFGWSEGGPMSILFSATWPERTEALILWGSFSRFTAAPDYPWGFTEERLAVFTENISGYWGRGTTAFAIAPALSRDPATREIIARWERSSASPSDALAIVQMNREIDVRHALESVHVPTLLMHRVGDPLVPLGASRYMAERIPGAKLVELPGDEHLPWYGDQQDVVEQVELFLTGERGAAEPDRVLATVLFTDIVGATERAAELGDRRWRELLEEHHARVRRELSRHRGREVDTAGDGFLATFDGPARAIRCARGIVEAVSGLGLAVRAGLHTGECELHEDKVTGIAVHIGARVAALAGAGEVLVSSTVRDLVAGSGISFADRGSHALKGVPGEWRVFQVAA